MRFLRQCFFAAPIGLIFACSGSDVTVAGDGDAAADGSGKTDAATDAAGSGDGATGGDSGDASTSDASDASTGDAIAMDARMAPCPDEHGKYTVVATGLGCGDLIAAAPQCITQTQCAITLSSSGTGGTKALNGDANLANDGSFTGAAIKEGSINRTGCVGTWDANTSKLTVDCGGVGSTQSCHAVLTRAALNCN